MSNTSKIYFSSIQDPTTFTPNVNLDGATMLTFVTPADAKKAEKLFNNIQTELIACQQKLEKAEVELAAVRKDAERYRFFRRRCFWERYGYSTGNRHSSIWKITMDGYPDMQVEPMPNVLEWLDTTIDTAIKEES